MNNICKLYSEFVGDLFFEFAGSFLLCFAGYGYYAWLMFQPEQVWYMDAFIPIVFASSVSLVLYVTSFFKKTIYLSLSITLLFFVGYELSCYRVLFRIFCQFLGYFLAAYALKNIFGTVYFYQSNSDGVFSFIIEIFASFILSVIVVLAGKSFSGQNKRIMIISTTIVLLGWTAGSYSGAIMNHGLYCAKLLLDKSNFEVIYLVSPVLGSFFSYVILSFWFGCRSYKEYCQRREGV